MVVLAHWSACVFASGVLLPHIATDFFDEIDATWVNVDVIVLNKPYAIHYRVLTFAAWSNAIHAKLIPQLRNILGICAVSNNLLL